MTRSAGPDYSVEQVDSPPPFRLRYDRQELVLTPYTWCYDSGCVDGAPQKHSPSVGSPSEVLVHVPVDGWELSATFVPTGQRCGRHQTVEPSAEDGWYVLRPAGRADAYDVDLFAQGGGDMVAQFRWDTPYAGEPATPRADLALIADHDGRPDSYGVELNVENLATTPRSASARITVTSSNGRSLTFDANADDGDCWPEGTVRFDGPDAQGRAAARLGDAPFRYDVVLTIDGRTHRAVAAYPDDEIKDLEPFVSLDFSPALPAPQ